MMSADDVLPYSEVRRLEVFTGAGRRRRWTAEAKARIVAESYASSVGTVAELYGLRPTQVFSWRRKARGMSELSFAPVTVTKEETVATSVDADVIEVRIGEALVRIPRDANAALAGAVISALTGSR